MMKTIITTTMKNDDDDNDHNNDNHDNNDSVPIYQLVNMGQTKDNEAKLSLQANGGRWKNRRTKLRRCISPGDNMSYLHTDTGDITYHASTYTHR